MKKDRMRKRFFNSERVYQIVINTFVGFMVLICLYPLIYVISASLMSATEWNQRAGLFLFPHSPTLEAYGVVLKQTGLYYAFGVSVARVIAGPLTGIFMCFVTGYTLSRQDFFGKKFLSIFIFITLVYGAGFVPSYLVIEATGLYNTFWVYIIPGLLTGWTTLVFRQTFTSSPPSIEESARMDGASELDIMFRIMLPINMPTVAVMLLFGAVSHWNAWFDSMVYVESNNMALIPLQLYLKNAFSATDSSTTGLIIHAETQKMVIAVIGIVPILCVYPFFQKYFTKGVYMGAVKG